MKFLLRHLGLLVFTTLLMTAADFSATRSAAEAAFTEGSFARAYELYRSAPTNLTGTDARWLAFRVPDSRWRAQGENLRNEEVKAALNALESAFPATALAAERDPIWAEAQESVGDLWSRRGESREQVKARYGLALDWWAGQSDLDTARVRYLAIVSKLAIREGNRYRGRTWADDLDPSLLNRAVEIARAPADVAQFRFLRARQFSQLAPPDERALYLGEDDFLAALKPGKASPWYDAALFEYAEWLNRSGRLVLPARGAWGRLPDAPRALERYRQLTSEFREGESAYWHQAQSQADSLLAEHLGTAVEGAFLPGSEVQFHLEWRNLRRVEWTLKPVSLPDDVRLTDLRHGAGEWLDSLAPTVAPVQRGTFETRDDGFHNPGETNVVVPEKLAAGAYLLEVKGGKMNARELVLVSDVVLSLKTGAHKTLAWLTDVTTGQPVGGARVKLWRLEQEPGKTVAGKAQLQTTGADGVAVFEFEPHNAQIFVSATAPAAVGSRQALAVTWADQGETDQETWRLYVFTDRPAYRPSETVRWKVTARQRRQGVYRTPADAPVHYEVTDPRQGKVTNGVVRLNAFGSGWAEFPLGAQPVLGAYAIAFWEDAAHQRPIGSAMLFRSEEYKLPEFEVKVRLPEEELPDGGRKPRTYRLGERVEVTIQADYYAGGAVADGEVELLVHQSPWHMSWPRPREFPWYYDDESGARGYGRFPGADQIVKRETLRTDVTGKAVFSWETDAAGSDVEFRIEARVRDAARREVTGTGDVRVTRQRYFVSSRTLNQVGRPGATTRLEFRAQDANRQPVGVAGTVKITRERWTEIWLDPAGKEWTGAELDAARSRSPVWPPPVPPGEKPWRIKHRGYDRDELRTETVSTGTNGLAELVFTPDRDGFYRFAWSSPGNATAPRSTDPRPQPFEPEVTSETQLWVCSAGTTDLGYRSGGVKIILDADTARVGSRLPVLLVTAAPDRWVLLTTEIADDFTHEVVHVTGTAQRREIDLTERHVPNFHLGALSVFHRELHTDDQEVVVPADRHFLDVTVSPDQPAYGPREEGSLLVSTRDREGRPVSAEVALGVVDDSVYAIQEELAGDPRQVFFGQKRPNTTRLESGFSQRQFVRLVKGVGAHAAEIFDDRTSFPEPESELEADVDDGEVADSEVIIHRSKSVTPLPASERVQVRARGAMAMSLGRAAAGGRMEMMAMAAPAMLADAPGQGAAQAPNPAGSAVVVRSDFRATAFWQPDLVTGADGQVRVPVKYPDSLTRWRVTARAVGPETSVGWSTTNTRTRSPLMVRLQAPRFFVTGDLCVVSSLLVNQTDHPLEVRSVLEASGVTITGGYRNGEFVKESRPPTITVPAHGQFLDNWAVQVPAAGPVKLKVSALPVKASQATLADAMEREYVAYPHGIEKFLAVTGQSTGDVVEARLDLPTARVPGSTRLTVRVTPSRAIALLDALPYLADYPYGCTEQTLSRFLPAVLVRKTLRDLGLDAETALNHAFGGITPGPQGQVAPRLGAKKDLSKLDEMVRAGLDRLLDSQQADGSWGWWKEGASDPWMTAYVVWGLNLALEAGVTMDIARVDRGVDWLERHLADQNRHLGTQVWMLHALAAQHRRTQARVVRTFQSAAFQNLWTQRESLSGYERALLLLAAQSFGRPEQVTTLVRNLENGVVRSDAANSALLPGATQPAQPLVHWGQEQNWWRWTDGAVESTATALRALLLVDPKNALVEPALNWLLKNRRGAQWSNTRDTALALLALNEHLRFSGEARADGAFAVEVNGREIGQRDLRGRALWDLAGEFTVPAELIANQNTVRIRRTAGQGPLYYSADAAFFTAEEPITPAGNELFVRREYFKLVGRPTLLKGLVYDRQPLRDGERVKSGDRVEAVLTVETKNDYEYLLFEDLKPAGLEAASLTSGGWLSARRLRDGRAADHVGQRDPGDYLGNDRAVYPEWRDRQAALFVDQLPTGFWEVRYQFRAEVPGNFHALPVVAHAMYVPELRANSAEIRVQVRD